MKNIGIFCKLYIFLNAAFRFGMWHLEYGYEAHCCSWPTLREEQGHRKCWRSWRTPALPGTRKNFVEMVWVIEVVWVWRLDLECGTWNMVMRLIAVPGLHWKRSKGTEYAGEAEEHQRPQVQERMFDCFITEVWVENGDSFHSTLFYLVYFIIFIDDFISFYRWKQCLLD